LLSEAINKFKGNCSAKYHTRLSSTAKIKRKLITLSAQKITRRRRTKTFCNLKDKPWRNAEKEECGIEIIKQ
jgi:hypothetical protein